METKYVRTFESFKSQVEETDTTLNEEEFENELNEGWVAGEMISPEMQAALMFGVASVVGSAWFMTFKKEIQDWFAKNKKAGLKAFREFIGELKKKKKIEA